MGYQAFDALVNCNVALQTRRASWLAKALVEADLM